MAQRSVTDIVNVQELLDKYCSPNEKYAWPLYDEDPSPGILCGADLTAPAFLSYPIKRKYLDKMGCAGSPYATLLERMREFVATAGTTCFATLSVADVKALADRARGTDVNGPEDWQALVRCLDSVQNLDGFTSVAVTKILHRKRPDLVLINDKLVRKFYTGRSSAMYPIVFREVRRDLGRDDTKQLLADLIASRANRAEPLQCQTFERSTSLSGCT